MNKTYVFTELILTIAQNFLVGAFNARVYPCYCNIMVDGKRERSFTSWEFEKITCFAHISRKALVGKVQVLV